MLLAAASFVFEHALAPAEVFIMAVLLLWLSIFVAISSLLLIIATLVLLLLLLLVRAVLLLAVVLAFFFALFVFIVVFELADIVLMTLMLNSVLHTYNNLFPGFINILRTQNLHTLSGLFLRS